MSRLASKGTPRWMLASLVAGGFSCALVGSAHGQQSPASSAPGAAVASDGANATPSAAAASSAAPSDAPPPSASASPEVPAPMLPGELSVTLLGEPGRIFVDEREVGTSGFRGPLAPGAHRLRVERAGSETFEGDLTIESGEVHARYVSLRPSVATAPVAVRGSVERYGPYGGVQLFAAFQPLGSGTTLQNACETTGATSCSPGMNVGAGLVGHFGWFFDPLGLELAVLLSADRAEPSASFDGTTGSEINPIVASPERDENFTIGRFGGGGFLRGRFTHSFRPFRFSAAAGPGLVYRAFAFERKTTTSGDATSRVAEVGPNYLSPAFSLEVTGAWEFSESLALSLSLISWFEDAGSNASSAPRNDTFLDERPQATPAYQLASGPQWFLGPALGILFGP